MRINVFKAFGILVISLVVFTNADNSSPIWSFSADGSITSMDTISDCSDPSNGGNDLVIGTSFDSLYLLEAKSGSGQNKIGEPLWVYPFLSTINVIKSVPDMNNDGRPDIAIGDQNGVVALFSGGSGHLFWIYIANGATILSLDFTPDVNGDGVPEIIAGAENDTVYCLSGLVANMWDPNPQPRETTPLWVFNTNPKGMAKIAAVYGANGPSRSVTAVNSVKTIFNNSIAYGIIAGSSNNAVYCLSPIATSGTPAVKWKYTTEGDVWETKAFPDENGDGINEVLVACGDNKGYLLSGKDGAVLWTKSVDSGATTVDIIGDQNGDGFSDALIGDGSGKIHCVSGKANGTNVAAIWVYSTGDNQTITSISHLKDVDGDGKDECIFGSTNDSVYVVSSGKKIWSAYMGGTVTAVSAVKDVNGDGFDDVTATSEGSICTVFKGQGTIQTAVLRSIRCNLSENDLHIKASQKKISASFTLQKRAALSMEVVDSKGRRVFYCHETTFESGNHSFDKTINVSPGNYVFIVSAQNKKTIKNFQIF